MSYETEIAQAEFLTRGGVAFKAIGKMRDAGTMYKPGQYQFQEYPKMLRISEGTQDRNYETETIKGGTRSWTVTEEVFRDVVVHSEEEEERVLSGGKTRDQVEGERQELIAKCRIHGIAVDMSWTVTRLRRELGEKVDAPDPAGEMAALKKELEMLREMQELRRQVEELKAQMAVPADDVEDVRAQLLALGVSVDKRWGAPRLREELDKATAPDARAA